jgi:hypothetical protein
LNLNQYRDTDSSFFPSVKNWLRRHQTWLLLIGLLFVSFLIAL